MSGEASSSKNRAQLTPEQLVGLYTQSLPDILGVTLGQAPQLATGLAQAQAGAAPIYTEGDLGQLTGFAPQFAKAGGDIASIQAGQTADLIGGEGGRAAQEAAALDRSINPEYYATRERLAGSTADLLGSFGKGAKLGGGELAAVERSTNQGNTSTGQLGNNDATQTVANAMNFGQYARQKQSLLGQALATATGTLQTLQSTSFNPVSLATQAGDTDKNFALKQFNTKQAAPTAELPMTFGLGSLGALGSLGGASRSSSGSASGGIGCFITTAVCEFMGKADDCEELTILRRFRDEWLAKQPGGRALIKEYYRVAPLIVKKLKRYKYKSVVYKQVWNHIMFCVDQIKLNRPDKALEDYIAMVGELKEI